jgi:hypothetical protein
MKLCRKPAALLGAALALCLLSACGTKTAPAQARTFFAQPQASSAPSAPEDSSSADPNRLSDEDAPPDREKEVLEQLETPPVSLSAGSGTAASAPGVDGGAYTGPIQIKTVSAPGKNAYKKGGSVIDASNATNGYVMVRQSGTEKRLKAQVKKDGMTYNYDLNHDGNYEAFPLQMGDGSYTVRIMENVSGSSYRELFSASFPVKLSSSLAPFLYPNQYVNYTASSAAVKKSYDLCSGSKTDVDKLKAVYNFLIKNIKYDYGKAAAVKSGYLPNVDSILASKKGICFDYSALMAAMLRAQNVPTKLVVGSADAVAATHSWNEVYLQGKGWITIKIQNTSAGWKLMDATFGASNSTAKSYTAARVY